jgi:hypothetical protein
MSSNAPLPQGYEIKNLPPVQQAYYAKRGEPATYLAPTSTNTTGATIIPHNQPGPAAVIPTSQRWKGVEYFQFMTAVQTIIQLGMFACLVALVAKMYKEPTISSSTRR